MSFDLGRIRDEAAAAPLASPYPQELSIAVVNDAHSGFCPVVSVFR